MHKKISLFLLLCLVLWALPALAEWTADTAWVRTYNGPVSSDDWAKAIAVDGSGYVYVTGHSFGSGTGRDYATIKYEPDGDMAWVSRYNNASVNGDDWAEAIAVDGSGYVCVTGRSSGGSQAKDDYLTIRYGPNGTIAKPWPKRYNGPGNYYDDAWAIAVDGSGNLYVTGASYGSGTSYDYASIKYYTNGTVDWTKRFDGAASGDDRASDIAVDDFGYVYVTGASYDTVTSSYDYVTIKYKPNGDTAWVRTYNGPADGDDKAYAIAVDVAGNVYVTGWSVGSGQSHDYLTIKYLSNGNIASGWPARYNGPGNPKDEAYDIAVDGSGHVCVTGESQGNYCTIRYHFNGDTAWVRTYNGPVGRLDIARAIAVDDSGNVYVTGLSSKASGWPIDNLDFATVKYYPNGETDWVNRYNGPADSLDNAFDIAVDDSGNAYVTGYTVVVGQDLNYGTIKYVPMEFLRGDANGDEEINIGDVVYLNNYFYRSGPPPYPWEAGDADCDGDVDADDVDYLIDYLFRGGPPPVC